MDSFQLMAPAGRLQREGPLECSGRGREPYTSITMLEAGGGGHGQAAGLVELWPPSSGVESPIALISSSEQGHACWPLCYCLSGPEFTPTLVGMFQGRKAASVSLPYLKWKKE